MPRRAWLYLQIKPSQVPALEPDILAIQRRRCAEHCTRQGLTIVGESIDIGRFGPRQRRPGLDQALATAETRAFEVLVTPEPTRLPGKADAFQQLLERLTQAGVELQFGRPESPPPADYLTALRLQDQAERQQRKEQLQASLRWKRRLAPTPKPPATPRDAEAK